LKTKHIKNKFRWRYVLTLAFAHFYHDTYSSFLAPILPVLIKNLGLSLSLAALLSLFQRIPSLINPFIGVIADELPLTWFVVITPLITSIVMSLLPISSSYLFLFLLLITTGLSSAFFHVPAPVLVRKVSGKRVGAGMSFFMFGGELARCVGPLVILGAVTMWGMKGTYRLIYFGIAGSVFLYFMLKQLPEGNGKARNKKITQVGSGNSGEQQVEPAEFAESTESAELEKERKYLSGLRDVLKRHKRLFIILSGIIFSKSLIVSSFTAFLPTYLTSRGSSLWLAGISLSVLEFAGAAGTFASGALSDFIGRKWMLLLTTLLSPVFFAFFLVSHGVFILPSLILLGFFIFSASPVIMALVQDSENEYPASANGIYMMLNFVINSVIILLIGIAGDRIGLENTYKLCLVVSLSGIPFVLLL